MYIYKDNDVVAHLRNRRMKLFEEWSPLKNVGSEKPEGRGLAGRPKCKWWDQVVSHTTYVWNSVEIAGTEREERFLVLANPSWGISVHETDVLYWEKYQAYQMSLA